MCTKCRTCKTKCICAEHVACAIESSHGHKILHMQKKVHTCAKNSAHAKENAYMCRACCMYDRKAHICIKFDTCKRKFIRAENYAHAKGVHACKKFCTCQRKCICAEIIHMQKKMHICGNARMQFANRIPWKMCI